MDLYPLDPLGLAVRGPVDEGWARSIRHGPSTIPEVLARGLVERMTAEDEAEAYRADPLTYVRARRPRRRLIDRLLRGRAQ